MIFPVQAVRIVIATRPVDFRKGHDGLAAMASLIETCKLNAVDPFAYVRETLTAIATANRHRQRPPRDTH